MSMFEKNFDNDLYFSPQSNYFDNYDDPNNLMLNDLDSFRNYYGDFNDDFYFTDKNSATANINLIHSPIEEEKKKIVDNTPNSRQKTNFTNTVKDGSIFSITKDNKKKNQEEEEEEIEILGKKRNLNNGGKHDKFSYDNMTRKFKNKFINSLISYTNGQIEPIEIENAKKKIKKVKMFLLKINQKIVKDINVVTNQRLLNTKLIDLFSDDISTKMVNYGPDYNRKVIAQLKENEENQTKVLSILDKTFLECLEHFRGSKYYEELAGLEKEYDNVINALKEDGETEDYLKVFKDFVGRFDAYYQTKKARPSRKANKQ